MAHTFTNLLFHIIFGTKDRYPFIEPELRPDLHAYVGGIVREIGGAALSIGGTDDHIHILAKLPPVLAISNALRLVKTNSSKWVREQRGMRSKFGWQSGFAAFSVSESSARSVMRYIERQEAHHRKRTFAEEYIEFLEKNHIPYDPRYVFE